MGESISEEELAGLLERISAKGQWDTQVMPLSQMPTAPQEEGSPANIRRISPVRLIVNREQHPLFEIRISDDNMIASIVVHEIQSSCLSSANSLEIRDVLETIQSLKIKAELDYEVLFQELRNPSHQPVVFARGVPAVPEIDAHLEFYFHHDNEYAHAVPRVKSGEVVGKKIPIKDGSLGCDLFGSILFPARSIDVDVVGGDGIDILPDGTIIATKAGRPRVTGTFAISICT